MTGNSPDEKQSQKAKAGRDSIQVGRDYSNTTNISLWISFFVIAVFALGGLAWALNIGLIRNPQNIQQSQPNSTPNTSP
jgi:hypothetical protein